MNWWDVLDLPVTLCGPVLVLVGLVVLPPCVVRTALGRTPGLLIIPAGLVCWACSQIRTTSGPHIMASLRNLVSTTLRLAGTTTSIAAALHYHARRPARPLQAIMNC